MQLATTSTILNVPRTIGGLSDIASSFNLLADHWVAPSPSSSSLAALTLPVNSQDRAAAWLVGNWNVSSAILSNTEFVENPFSSTNSDEEDLVLSTTYPKGTRDGDQFFMTPMRVDSKVQTAVLQYEVSFSIFSFSRLDFGNLMLRTSRARCSGCFRRWVRLCQRRETTRLVWIGERSGRSLFWRK